MRKRSKYRPKGVLLDTMKWLKTGMQPVGSAGDHLVSCQLKNHSALDTVRKGVGARTHMDTLFMALNMAEAYARLNMGVEYMPIIRAGQDALYAIATRGASTGRFVFRGQELSDVIEAMDVHDAQLEASSIADLERAVAIVRNEIRHKRARLVDPGSWYESA